MATIDVTAEEADALSTALRSYLNDLQEEIAHTDDYDFRHALQHRRTVLEGIMARLTQSS